MTEHPFVRRRGALTYAITQEALDAVATSAATSAEGVEVPDRRLAALRRTHLVEVADDRVRVTLPIACRYGVPIPAAAAAVQDRVADRLGRLTGLPVGPVDVTVVGVARP
jgi:uncharacterized alkaline shock family protein YloU